MLRPTDLLAQKDGLGISHRETRHVLRWAPVQWYGIGLGWILATGLACELSLLGGVLDDEVRVQRSLMRAASTEGLRLSELDAAARQVLQLRDRPTCADTLSRLLASFPRQVRVRETNLNLEGTPLLSVNATVHVAGTAQLESVLQDLVSRVRAEGGRRLSAFSLGDIDVQADPAHAGLHYLVLFRIPLT
jgi:hypothetical protein